MGEEVKDTVSVIAANGGALGITLTQCNEILQLVSLILAIAYTGYKIFQAFKKHEA
tara:strand:- start:250 stop:417 length:168 start_codon:yes stop_codon:yes gene_type:complete